MRRIKTLFKSIIKQEVSFAVRKIDNGFIANNKYCKGEKEVIKHFAELFNEYF